MLRLYTHPICLQHDPGLGHAESPARLRAVLDALDHDRFAALDRIEAPRATLAPLLRFSNFSGASTSGSGGGASCSACSTSRRLNSSLPTTENRSSVVLKPSRVAN